jgi:hypothetical protein
VSPGTAWLCVVLSQYVPQPDLDRGAIAGRVCIDRDGNGRCASDEPGLPGVRVMTETGLWAVTDDDGRYHFADLDAQTLSRDQGSTTALPRLVLGHHRVKLDPLTLDEGVKVTPWAATVEVPPGALVTQDFAVAVPEREIATVHPASRAHPRGDLSKGALRVQVTGQVAAGERVVAQGKTVEVDPQGVYRAWIDVHEGSNRIALRVEATGNRSRFYLQTVDVSRRGASVLIIPRPVEPVGLLTVPASATGDVIITLEAPEHTRVEVDGVAVDLPPAGRLAVPLGRGRHPSLHVKWTTVRGEIVEDDVRLEAPSGVSVAGLLEGEVQIGSGGITIAGRGAAALRGRLMGFDFSGELDLNDQDLRALAQKPQVAGFFVPRDPAVLERALPITAANPQWSDDSATVSQNPAGAHLRAEVSREGLGRLGYGTYHAQQGSESEVGRFYRSLTGAYLEARTPDEKLVHAGARAFYAPGAADPLRGLALQPRHERFTATGGSLFYLAGEAAQGSERVRVEIVDGVTGLPLSERHLTRGVDYSIDYLQGRILLAQPLWSFDGSSMVPTESHAQVLWVDYEHPVVDPNPGRVWGAEGRAGAGPVTLTGGFASEPQSTLARGNATLQLSRVWATVEVARSLAIRPELMTLGLSDDGGLTWASPKTSIAADTSAFAVTGRVRAALYGTGWVDVAFRWRDKGFVDSTHYDLIAARQISARFEQPIKGFVFGGVFDDRRGEDPRQPFSASWIAQRVAGGHVGWDADRWGVRLEARDVQLSDFTGDGGRTSAALSGRFAVTDWLTLRASYRQMLVARGTGDGAFNDTFASGGVDLKPSQAITLGIRGGWGPGLGPQIWGTTSIQRGDEVFYGGHSLDVDAPAVGEHRVVTGVRKEIEPGTSVFVEDAAAQDITSLRLSRAIGITQQLPHGLSVSLRYERGLRDQLEAIPLARSRDAGGASLSWVGTRARAWLRGEARYETGGGVSSVLQVLGWGGGEVSLRDNLRATLSATYSHTAQGGSMTARFFDGIAALAWRFEWGMLVLRYVAQDSLLPSSPQEIRSHTISLLPSFHVLSRLTVSAGGHLQWLNGAWNLIGSIRPAVRIVWGLEAGVEAAVRTLNTDGGGYGALRAELGYRFLSDSFLIAAGGTIIGYQLVDPIQTGNVSRFYVRGEVAY